MANVGSRSSPAGEQATGVGFVRAGKRPSASTIAGVVIFAVWAVSRGVLFAAGSVWTLPDSAKYLPPAAVSVTGEAPSPGWLVPFFFSSVDTNDARTWLQFGVATICWATAAWILGGCAAAVWRRWGVIGLTLLVGISMPVLSLDRIIQTESLTMSLTVLWMACWVRLISKRSLSGLLPWAMATIATLLLFARPQSVVVVGPASILLILWLVWRTRSRSIAAFAALGLLTAVTVWAPIALANFDEVNDHKSARAYFFSWYRGTDAGYRQMEIERGRPNCAPLDAMTASDSEAARHFAWDFYLDPNGYQAQCPQLAGWHYSAAPSYGGRLLADPVSNIRLLWRDAPLLDLSWVRGTTPAPLGDLQATVFGIADQPGTVNTEPQPGVHSWFDPWGPVASPYSANGIPTVGLSSLLIWLVAMVALSLACAWRTRRRRECWLNRMSIGIASLIMLSAAGIGFAWLADAWEMDRHALPWTILLRLLLLLLPLLGFGAIASSSTRQSRPNALAAPVALTTLCLGALLMSYLGPATKPEPLVADRLLTLPHTKAQGDRLRERLRSVIFDAGEEPSPQRIVDLKAAPESAIPATLMGQVGSAQSFSAQLRPGFVTTGLIMTPKAPPHCAVVFQGGHASWDTGSTPFIDSALKRGCVVAGINMPLMGVSDGNASGPDGAIGLTDPRNDHHSLPVLDRPGDQYLDVFFTGPLSLIQWLRSTYPGAQVVMSGFSGGGWITSVASALDPSIRRSIAVAGSAEPISPINCSADGEQCDPRLIDVVSLQQIYFLAGFGEGRVAGQVLNQGDPCCNAGIQDPWWLRPINVSLAQVGGGTYDYVVDATQPPDHRVPAAAQRMLARYLTDFNVAPRSS